MSTLPGPNGKGPSKAPEKTSAGGRGSGAPDSVRFDPLIGRTVGGKYTITAVIARGGMGKVYKAVQAPLDRVCAIKVLSPKYHEDEDPEFQRRFFREASTASKLTHANTVTIYDYGRDGDVYFIAMEYVRGRTLYQVLREDGPLDEVSVCHIVREVARSLREAHALGVIHRDMKPANVVITTQGAELSLKVLDFGLVKKYNHEDTDDLTQEGLFMGSPKYMAPEQILGNPVSPRTDIYALGVLAYELLTGDPPFDRGNSVKTLMAHVNDEPVPMRQAFPPLRASDRCVNVFMRCLSKDPQERFASMNELLEALAIIDGIAPSRRLPSLHGDEVRPPFSSSEALLVAEDPTEVSESLEIPSHSQSAFSDPTLVDIAPMSEWNERDGRGADGMGSESSERFPSGTPAPMSQPNALRKDRRWLGSRGMLTGLTVGCVLLGAAVLVKEGSVGDSATRVAADVEISPQLPTVEMPPEQPDKPVLSPTRKVVFLSQPRGAQVFLGAKLLCARTPCPYEMTGESGQELRITFRKSGYGDRVVVWQPNASEVFAQLQRPSQSARRPSALSGSPGKSKPPSGYKASPY